MSLFQADSVEVTVLVENWVDMLLPDRELAPGDHCVRTGLVEHFDHRRVPPQAENGISLLVTARRGRHTSTVLFDVGLTGSVLMHNLDVLGIDRDAIDHVVLSHGHPDHFGGVYSFLQAFSRPMPVVTSDEAFWPRYASWVTAGPPLLQPGFHDCGGRAARWTSRADPGCAGPGLRRLYHRLHPADRVVRGPRGTAR